MTPRSAWSRTVVLLAIVLEVPVLAHIVRLLTPEPRVESIVVDGVPVELVVPVGPGPWPAFHFVTGAHPERRQEPVVQRVSRGLARAGFVVAVPDLPGLGDGELTSRTFEAARAVTKAISKRPDVRDGSVALAGASAGAGIAIVTAASPELVDRVSVVAAVVPFADIERIACLATTSHYERNGTFHPHEMTALMRRVVGRSLVSSLTPGADRAALLERLREQDPDDLQALRCLEKPGRTLGPEAQLVVELLLNEDHGRFAELYRALPAANRRRAPGALAGHARVQRPRASRGDRASRGPVLSPPGSGDGGRARPQRAPYRHPRPRSHAPVARALASRRLRSFPALGPPLPRDRCRMTPTATKIALVGTLVVTTAVLAAEEVVRRDGPLSADEVAPILWSLTILFSVRVVGQVVVALRSPRWLPPMSDWNLVPYRVLLPAQLVILAVMVWIDASFSTDAGPATDQTRALGWPVIAFSAVYAAAMAVRYVVRMRQRPSEHWFGGTIPIVFHLVLATYLFALGSFHAGR